MKRLLRNMLTGLCAAFTVAFCTCFFMPQNAAASVSSIIIDANTGHVISAQNADELRYPASLTKLMTLYITFDALEKGLIKLEDELPVSRKAANRAPSRLGLKPGSTISVKKAIEALIVKSANDCATVLAEGLGYSEENFARTMTRVAKELGMKNTTFRNASGLPNRAQKTTARDMAILGAAMYHHFPQYYKWFSLRKFSYAGRTYYTHNHVLKNFKGADGMKTGFTNAAGFNIITSAEREGQRVIAVTMGHNTLKARDKKVIAMMDKGLTRLAMENRLQSAQMYAEVIPEQTKPGDIPSQLTARADEQLPSSTEEENAHPEVEQGSADAEQPLTLSTPADNNQWSIQIGAFSNYSKARNYASKIKKEKLKKFAGCNISIQAARAAAAVVYRARLTGFEKNDAKLACNHLKKSSISCIVVNNDSNNAMIMAAK